MSRHAPGGAEREQMLPPGGRSGAVRPPRRGCAVPPSGGSAPSSHRPRLAGLSNMEERERGARPAGAGSPARPPSPRLDVSSDSFDPLLALYAPRLPPIPYPNAPCFNNLAEYESFLRTGSRGGGRGRARGAAAAAGSGGPAAAGPSGRTRRRPDAPAPDSDRIQRLRRLMVAKEEGDGAAGAAGATGARRRGPARNRKAPRNVLTRMPCESGPRSGSGRPRGLCGLDGAGRRAARPRGRVWVKVCRDNRGPWGGSA